MACRGTPVVNSSMGVHSSTLMFFTRKRTPDVCPAGGAGAEVQLDTGDLAFGFDPSAVQGSHL